MIETFGSAVLRPNENNIRAIQKAYELFNTSVPVESKMAGNLLHYFRSSILNIIKIRDKYRIFKLYQRKMTSDISLFTNTMLLIVGVNNLILVSTILAQLKG